MGFFFEHGFFFSQRFERFSIFSLSDEAFIELSVIPRVHTLFTCREQQLTPCIKHESADGEYEAPFQVNTTIQLFFLTFWFDTVYTVCFGTILVEFSIYNSSKNCQEKKLKKGKDPNVDDDKIDQSKTALRFIVRLI